MTSPDSSNVNVHINGDRTQFISKNAVLRFKQALRDNATNDISLYFKPGWGYNVQKRENESITVDIIQLNQSTSSNTRDMIRNRLHDMKNKRVSQESVRSKMQKTVPRDIVDAYLDLKKRARIPIVDPCVAISKPDEYINQLRDMTKSFGNVENAYTTYHKLLFKHLDNLHQIHTLQQLATRS
jgi:hypothetical protein